MKFKLGDFVRFVDERREGHITRIIDEQMIGVTGDDDFEIPVPAGKVTLVHGQHETANDPEQNVTAKLPPGEFIDTGIYLAVETDTRVASLVHFHLVNATSFQLLAALSLEKSGSAQGAFAGIINPQTASMIYSASLNGLSAWPAFTLQIVYYSSTDYAPKEPIVYKEKFTAKDFSGARKVCRLLNQPAWLFELDTKPLVIDALKLKESFFKPVPEISTVPKPAKETDLHIEKLRDDYQFLSSSEILSTQLEEFRKFLAAAIVHKLPSVIIIHGTGNGTLKHEIHKIAGKHTGVKTFMDARKEKFGYGATEIWLK